MNKGVEGVNDVASLRDANVAKPHADGVLRTGGGNRVHVPKNLVEKYEGMLK